MILKYFVKLLLSFLKEKGLNNMNKKVITFLMIISCFFLSGCGKKEQNITNQEKKNDDIVENRKITIIDEESNSRPYAVVINNYPSAVKVQSGLNDAYMVYEIPVEGGMSRSLALFKDKTTTRVGTVRSARHNFLDYVMENDAIFVHFGWSHYAQDDISKLGINNINGLYDSPFWRENPEGLATEHTAYTGLDKDIEYAKNKGYRITTEEKSLLDYSTDKIDLSEKDGSAVANNVEIPYSDSYTVKFVYDAENENYKRYVNGVEHTDYFTKEQYTGKNIIVTKLDFAYTDDNYYLDLHNIGTGDGYYITNGYAVPIKWEKNDRSSKTVYKYLDGTPINVNDGNTWIMLQSINKTTTIN